MEFMEKITEISKAVGKTATDTYNTVADKSGKAIEDAKLRLAISDKENEIEQIYVEMGKTVFEAYKKGEDVGKAFSKESKAIEKKLKEIEEMNKKILFNKDLRICDECQEVIKVSNTYCPNCGTKQKPVKLKVEKKADKKNEKKTEPENIVCPECGLVCEPGTKFCTKCGKELK